MYGLDISKGHGATKGSNLIVAGRSKAESGLT